MKFTCQRDTLKIRGKIFGIEKQPKPVIILSHGFLANMKTVEEYALLLAKKYVTVIFDFCGGGLHSKSSGKSQDMTIFTEKEDLLSVISYIKQQPFVDPKHITLMGCSQGGVVSALAAKELGKDIEKMILLYPALCIPDDARKGKMMFYTFDPDNIPDLLGRFPMKLSGDYARTVINLDIYQAITGYKGPVLYLHGDKDDIVDISYARKGHKCFPKCEYHEIKKGGHGFTGNAQKEACMLIKAFML